MIDASYAFRSKNQSNHMSLLSGKGLLGGIDLTGLLQSAGKEGALALIPHAEGGAELVNGGEAAVHGFKAVTDFLKGDKAGAIQEALTAAEDGALAYERGQMADPNQTFGQRMMRGEALELAEHFLPAVNEKLSGFANLNPHHSTTPTQGPSFGEGISHA